ncbi:hypothetical protein [Vibrio algarum]|uniref:Uncharacterized protein n=1 Tax=Vibrio algarum TaxID=3020714 RepID=A0ABT4YUN1_9VIBR|nr:hypothetical protein [Vibrio sp. KJ40-1]MDB1125285.1 hypothetical protein [Vibrio sp. KJ40-1]
MNKPFPFSSFKNQKSRNPVLNEGKHIGCDDPIETKNLNESVLTTLEIPLLIEVVSYLAELFGPLFSGCLAIATKR